MSTPTPHTADLLARIRQLVADGAAQQHRIEQLAQLASSAAIRDARVPAPFELVTRNDPVAIRRVMPGLEDWVRQVLVPVYVNGREPGPLAPWCPRWWDHPEARARFYGLWLAFLELTDPDAGPTGPGDWHRSHLDPTLARLRDPNGPFAGCTRAADSPPHRVGAPAPIQPASPPPPPSPEDIVTDPDAVTVPAALMRDALELGLAQPLSDNIPEVARYQQSWWLLHEDAGSWLRVTNPDGIAAIDAEAERLQAARRTVHDAPPVEGTPLTGPEWAERIRAHLVGSDTRPEES
ncbi:MAG: DUF4913 domain-containing protein [Sporichthyaceae bacterium]|nr:DUF4913 domain-containing protein [Sporichthyaceae bacterium]